MNFKRVILTAVVAVVSTVCAYAQKITREEYIERYKHIAIAHMEYYGIPASITLAQGILESANGNSTLAREANNHFGIKCHTDWKGKQYLHDDDRPKECFRVYESPEQSFEDHAEFLSNHRQKRYDSLFVYAHDDYRNWARGLKAAGYATAPDYAERLIKIIEDNELYILDRENGETLYASGRDGGGRENVESIGASAAPKAEMGNSEGFDPDNYRVTVNAYGGYDVYRSNGVSYVISKEGDSYESLASLFRLGANRLRRFNEAAANAELKAGQIVYIEKKRKRWEGETLIHTVKAPKESLFDISQRYGVRLKPLARLNKVKPDAEFSKGRAVKLR